MFCPPLTITNCREADKFCNVEHRKDWNKFPHAQLIYQTNQEVKCVSLAMCFVKLICLDRGSEVNFFSLFLPDPENIEQQVVKVDLDNLMDTVRKQQGYGDRVSFEIPIASNEELQKKEVLYSYLVRIFPLRARFHMPHPYQGQVVGVSVDEVESILLTEQYVLTKDYLIKVATRCFIDVLSDPFLHRCCSSANNGAQRFLRYCKG